MTSEDQNKPNIYYNYNKLQQKKIQFVVDHLDLLYNYCIIHFCVLFSFVSYQTWEWQCFYNCRKIYMATLLSNLSICPEVCKIVQKFHSVIEVLLLRAIHTFRAWITIFS